MTALETAGDLVSEYGAIGAVTLQRAVTPDVLGELQETCDALLREAACGGDDPRFDRDADGFVRRINHPTFVHPAFDAVMRSDALLESVRLLVGDDVRFHSGKLNIKHPGRGGIEWHQDFAFFPHTNDDLVAVGLALDDTTVENGCLHVLAGSHRGPILDHHDASGAFVGAVRQSDVADAGPATPLPVPAGGATLHHARTVHGSPANRADAPRRVLFLQYTAADAFSISYAPLVALPDWDLLETLTVSGVPATNARMTSMTAPLPRFGGSYVSIFASQERSRFDTA